jgi:hypothetical protein
MTRFEMERMHGQRSSQIHTNETDQNVTVSSNMQTHVFVAGTVTNYSVQKT